MSNGGVCKTATAKPGLLIIIDAKVSKSGDNKNIWWSKHKKNGDENTENREKKKTINATISVY